MRTIRWLNDLVYRYRHRRQRAAMFERVEAQFRAAGIKTDR